MISLDFPTGPIRMLCLGAHCDDIELGCGGTVLRLLRERNDVSICWVIFSSTAQREREALNSAESFLKGAKEKDVVVNNFHDGFFPYYGREIKSYFEQLASDLAADVVFTHCRHDLHQDHRLLSELTWNTFRDQLILEYEILKYDGDLHSPNFFVHLDATTCRRKVEYMVEGFGSQKENHWFSAENFESLMRIRGVQSNAPQGFAEGFYCRKVIF